MGRGDCWCSSTSFFWGGFAYWPKHMYTQNGSYIVGGLNDVLIKKKKRKGAMGKRMLKMNERVKVFDVFSQREKCSLRGVARQSARKQKQQGDRNWKINCFSKQFNEFKSSTTNVTPLKAARWYILLYMFYFNINWNSNLPTLWIHFRFPNTRHLLHIDFSRLCAAGEICIHKKGPADASSGYWVQEDLYRRLAYEGD